MIAYIAFSLFLVTFIFISGLLSASETAITGASRAQIHQLAKKGDIRAKKVQKVQDNLASSISTILVAINFVNYIIPSATAWFASHYLDATWTTLVTILVAFLMAIYAEIFPKMLVINDICKFAMLIVPIIEKLIKILKPVVSVLEGIARTSLRIIGIKVSDSQHMFHSEEELRGAIEMHGESGDKDDTEKKLMLNSILDLEDTTVDSVMIHRKNLVTLDIDLPPSKILEEILKIPYSRIPLWKDNPENIIGILITRTFLSEAQKSSDIDSTIDVKSLMSPPWFIPETTHLLSQLQTFKKRREHFALVVDEYGDLMGSVTLEDILEEIVGEIADEYDTTHNGISTDDDGGVTVDAKTTIRDLNRHFGWNLPENGATTIGGLVMHEVRKIPDIGESYLLYSLKIEIIKRQKNQISTVKITKLSKDN